MHLPTRLPTPNTIWLQKTWTFEIVTFSVEPCQEHHWEACGPPNPPASLEGFAPLDPPPSISQKHETCGTAESISCLVFVFQTYTQKLNETDGSL